jgi:hypothetical protein
LWLELGVKKAMKLEFDEVASVVVWWFCWRTLDGRLFEIAKN